MRSLAIFLERIWYLFGPALSAGLLYHFALKTRISAEFISPDIEANAASAVMGYGFAAVFFLLALPRTGFLRRIDKSGKLVIYALTIGMSSMLATAHLVGSSFLFKGPKTEAAFEIVQFLFVATVAHFIWSLFILFLLLFQYRIDAGSPPARRSIRARRPVT